jgi:hypothetical protein
VGWEWSSEQIGQFVIGFSDQRGLETGLPDAMFFPETERDLLKALQQSRKSTGYAAVNTHFIDHEFPPENELCVADFDDPSRQYQRQVVA